MTETSKITAKAFDKGEKRTLALDAVRIDPKHLTDGKPPEAEAEYQGVENWPTHEARHYEIQGLGTRDQGPGKSNEPLVPGAGSLVPGAYSLVPVRVQLNAGDPADDEQRLAAIAEDLLQAPGTGNQAIEKEAPGTRDQAIGNEEESLVPGAKCLVPNGGES